MDRSNATHADQVASTPKIQYPVCTPKGVGSSRQIPLINKPPRIKNEHHFKILIHGNSCSGKSTVVAQLANFLGAPEVVWEGPTTVITERRFKYQIDDLNELVIIVVDTPGYEDSAHPDIAIRTLKDYLTNLASRYVALSEYERKTSDLLVDVSLVVGGAHMANRTLFEAAKVSSAFAPTIYCATKADAYQPAEMESHMPKIGQLMTAHGVTLWVPPGFNVGARLVGAKRVNIGGGSVDPLDPNAPVDNVKLWEYLNNNSAELKKEAIRRSRETITSRGLVRRVGDRFQALWHSSYFMWVVVVTLVVLLGIVIQKYGPDLTFLGGLSMPLHIHNSTIAGNTETLSPSTV